MQVSTFVRNVHFCQKLRFEQFCGQEERKVPPLLTAVFALVFVLLIFSSLDKKTLARQVFFETGQTESVQASFESGQTESVQASFESGQTESVVAADVCDAATVPCKPTISGGFGSRLSKEPSSPGRSWVVVCTSPSADGKCDFGSIREALRAIEYNHKKGNGKLRTIRVKPGTYRISNEGGIVRLGSSDGVGAGTRSRPMALVAYDENRAPVIQGSCSRSECARGPNGERQSVVVAGDWWLLDGLAFKRLDWAVFIDAEHVTVRNSLFDTASKFAINISHRSLGYVHIEDNHFERVGFDHTHHGIYASNGQGSSQVRSNGGCGVLNTEKIIKDQITIRGNYFADITGAAVQLNASHSNWQDHRDISGFHGRRIPDTGIHGTLIENNVIVDTGFGINLYRYAIGARIVNNTLVSTRDGRQKSQGHFIQLRNAAYNVIANNLFYSDLGGKNTVVGFQECSKDPANDLNVIDYNLWCVPGNAEYSWNQGGTGLFADRAFSSFKSRTKQESHGIIGTVGQGVCSGLKLNAGRFELPQSRREAVSDNGVGVLKTPGKSYVDFNGDNRRNGGDLAASVCPVDDYVGRYRRVNQCDIGAHEYNGQTSPPSGAPPPSDPPPAEPEPEDPPPKVTRAPLDLPGNQTHLILQFGADGYEDIYEAHIREDKPNTEYGRKTRAWVSDDSPSGSGRHEQLLIKWGLPGSAGSWKVNKGEIWLFVSERVKGNGFKLYPIRKGWQEATVTWNAPWSKRGAHGTTDRGTEMIGNLPDVELGWNKIELTDAGIEEVQRWVDAPWENHGLIVSPADSAGNMMIITSEHGTEVVRPILVLNVDEVAVMPPPTMPADSPVPLPDMLPRGAAVHVYQQGYDGYSGAADARISQEKPDEILGDDEVLQASGDMPEGSGFDSHIVLRFDKLDVERGEKICAAELWLHAEQPIAAPGYDVYALTRSWNEREVTWQFPWSTPGAQGTTDRTAEKVGTVLPESAGWYRISLNDWGLAVVQSWIELPMFNRGFVIQNPQHPGVLRAKSSDHPTRKFRPVLLIATGDGPEGRMSDDSITDDQTADLLRGDEAESDDAQAYLSQKGVGKQVSSSSHGTSGTSGESAAPVPNRFVLGQNYPNPFHPATRIPYSVPEAAHVDIRLFDMLGREITTLVNRMRQPGNYAAPLNIAGLNLPSGVYLYRMVSGDFQQVRRLTIQR